MQVNYLNLERRPDRNAAFLKNNSHLDQPRRQDCIDGPKLGTEGLKRYGVDRPKLAYYSEATIGNQLSHLRLWQSAAYHCQETTIAEDDAVFHQRFEESYHPLLQSLPDDWDIMLWGWTFNCGLNYEILPELRTAWLEMSDRPTTPEANKFKDHPYDAQAFRVYAAWNSFAYTISPKGAHTLLAACSQIKDEQGLILARRQQFPIYGIDAKLCSIMPQIAAYVCVPPLAYHIHDPKDTDMLPDGHVPREASDELPTNLPPPMTTND